MRESDSRSLSLDNFLNNFDIKISSFRISTDGKRKILSISSDIYQYLTNRYGVAGSLTGYVDRRWGRGTTVRLLGMVTEAEMLTALGVTEPELLEAWRGDVAGSAR